MVRECLGILDAEAYDLKSTTKDITSYPKANMYPEELMNIPLKLKPSTVHKPDIILSLFFFQGLGWKMYNWPTNPQKIINNNHNEVVLKQRKNQVPPPAQPKY